MRNFYKGAFAGVAFFTSYTPFVPEPSSYDKVTFYAGNSSVGGCIIDKVYGVNGTLEETDIAQNANLDFAPVWGPNVYLLAEFNNSYSGGNVTNITSPITEWQIYRGEVGQTGITQVGVVDVLEQQFIDYTALKGKDYIYYLFAANDTEISSPLLSNEVHCDYYGWYLIDVDNDIVYVFDIDVQGGQIVQEEEIEEYNTNLPYNAYSRGATNFVSGNITAWVPEDICDMSQSVDYVEQLREFIFSDRTKYLKDVKGRIFKVFTSGYTDSMITYGLKDEPRYISFDFQEIGEV